MSDSFGFQGISHPSNFDLFRLKRTFSTSLTTSAMSRDLMFLFLQFQTHVLRQRRDADSFVTIFFTSITSVQPHWLGPVVFILMVV
jgi:hypothetical protein